MELGNRRSALLGNRRAGGSPWENTFHEVAVLDDRHTVHKYKFDACRILKRLLERGLVDHRRGIEYGDVRVSADADSSLIFECRRSRRQLLGRHETHFA